MLKILGWKTGKDIYYSLYKVEVYILLRNTQGSYYRRESKYLKVNIETEYSGPSVYLLCMRGLWVIDI